MSPLVAKSLLGTTVTQGAKSKDRSILVSLFPFGAHRLVCKIRKELRESPKQRFDSAYASTLSALKKCPILTIRRRRKRSIESYPAGTQPRDFLTYCTTASIPWRTYGHTPSPSVVTDGIAFSAYFHGVGILYERLSPYRNQNVIKRTCHFAAKPVSHIFRTNARRTER